MMAKSANRRRGPGRKGYSPEVRAKILTAAKKESLTGKQVKKRFGISTLTFYRWRGPVRGKKGATRPGPGRPPKPVTAARVRQIIREEVAAFFRRS
jgi:transposase-like protein